MYCICREWKYFQYDPRTVSFPCESERVVTGTSPGPVRQELKLPQFSSAAIPKARKLAGEADSSTRLVFISFYIYYHIIPIAAVFFFFLFYGSWSMQYLLVPAEVAIN